MRSLSKKKRELAVKAALFNAHMEGFQVPASVVKESNQVLTGKRTANELVRQYALRYSKH